MVFSDERLGNIPEDRILLREIVHVCVVVEDVEEKARAFADKFGIGPFEIREKHYDKSKGMLHGEPVEYTLKFGYAKMGTITLELVETLEGETLYKEFLEEHGEGIHHIGIPTPLPFDEELNKWTRLGIKPLMASRLEDPGEGWAYMDTQNLVGCVLEILSLKKYQ
jgi:hypothetical protein